MKIKEVPKIEGNESGTEGLTVTRDKLHTIIEIPCLEACLELYDKNIRTISSNGNLKFDDNTDGIAYIMVDYNSLSEENKEIAIDLSNKGIISSIDEFPGRDIGPYFNIKVPMNSESEVSYISSNLLKVASLFMEQDVLYGFSTEKDAHDDMLNTYGLDLNEHDLIDTEISLGKIYDETEKRFWDNAELLDKHRNFLGKNKDLK